MGRHRKDHPFGWSFSVLIRFVTVIPRLQGRVQRLLTGACTAAACGRYRRCASRKKQGAMRCASSKQGDHVSFYLKYDVFLITNDRIVLNRLGYQKDLKYIIKNY